jgi:energy-coupling factor transporter ATP-binding protein EcfA2
MLGRMGLSGLESRSVFRLSGGEKQRLALAGLLIRKPGLLILDEPTTGIDAENRGILGEILRELLKSGTAALLITHDIDFADAYCGVSLRLDGGALS